MSIRAVTRVRRRRVTAGIRRDGLRNFFARLAEEEGAGPEWLATHPPSAERAEASRTRAEVDPASLTTSLDEVQWQTLVAACADAGEPEPDLEGLIF